MHVLILTHGTIHDVDRVLSGNSIRAWNFAQGLVEAGFEVTLVYPRELAAPEDLDRSTLGPCDVRFFADPIDLHRIIAEIQPEAILVGYWELLEHFPDDYAIPLIVDLIAPRILEVLFQEGESVDRHASRMLALYRKASRFICGTERQRRFLIPWLILAGFDVRFGAPIDIIPISTAPIATPPRRAPDGPWTLVTGGVTWPWRMGERYLQAIKSSLADGGAMSGRLIHLSGHYVHEADAVVRSDRDAPVDEARVGDESGAGLLPYGEMERFFRERCHIGIELSDYNLEREFSASFRSIEFLRCGLPVICNDYLDLADAIRAYDAGWVIERPEDLTELLRAIAAQPESYEQKSRNALRLIEDVFDHRKRVRPLIDFLRAPATPGRRTDWLFQGAEPVIAELEREARRLQDVVRARDDKIAALEGELQAVLTSSSWRLTAPVRALVIRMRQMRGSVLHRLLFHLKTAWRHPGPLPAFAAAAERYRDAAPSEPLPRRDQTGRYVAIVTREDVFPTNHGAAVKIERSAWGLSHSVDGVFLITGDWGRYYVFRKGHAEEHYFPRWIRMAGPLGLSGRKRLLRMGVPLNEAYIYHASHDWGYAIRLGYLALRYRIILYQAEFPAYVIPCLRVARWRPATTMLVEHNVECDRIKTQYPETSVDAYEWLRDLEVDACNQVDHVIAVSEPDRALLVKHGVQPEKISVIPHGVDLGRFDREYPTGLRETYGIPAEISILVYHGIYSYRPNLESIEVMATEILPRLKARGIAVKVFAIGPEPPPSSPHPDVIFTGSVDELAPFIKSADLAVVPLQQGGGTRMKILEYFAAKVPVITTAKGIEGIPVEHGVHALILDSFDEIADAIVHVLAHPEDGARMAERAKAYVNDLDWKRIAQRYLDLLK